MDLLNSPLNSRLWNRHGVKIVWAVAAFVMLLSLASIGYQEYRDRQAKAADYAPQSLPPIANNRAPAYRVTDITSANLFGDPRPKVVQTQNVRTTNLNLKLIGVLWSNDQDMARVIIQSGNKKADLYGVGENIKGAGASVQEIRANEIFINRNGATEKLALEKKKGSDIISFQSVGYNNNSVPAGYQQPQGISRSNKPISPNGDNRKIRKPNFSGLDRALEKMGEI